MIFVFGGAYAGKEMYAKKEFPNKKIIRDIHILVRETMKNGKNPRHEIERLLEKNSDAVFITNEIGCGIVPVDEFEREWREECGRINCYLTGKADRVIRVICGIGVIVK